MYLIFVVISLASVVGAVATGERSMMDNQKNLSDAKASIRAFETEKEPERLREASSSLVNVDLRTEHDAAKRHTIRAQTLSLWLDIIRALDANLDPDFDPDDVPPKLVQPPPTSSGVVYPPGADPALIDKPEDRARYQKEVDENREKQKKYRIQIHLRRLNESIPPKADAFISSAYTGKKADQEEARKMIEGKIENDSRRERLLRVLNAIKR